jgi:hypothetical protein
LIGIKTRSRQVALYGLDKHAGTLLEAFSDSSNIWGRPGAGHEWRLRATPSPYHDDGLIDALAEALVDVWQRLDLPFNERALAAE